VLRAGPKREGKALEGLGEERKGGRELEKKSK